MKTYEPVLGGDCLKLVDCIRSVLGTQLTPNGSLSPLGIKVISAVCECLESKLGGPRRGPVSVVGRGSDTP